MTLNLVRDRELEAATTPLPPSSISPSVEVRVVASTTPFDAGRPLTTEDHRILAKVKKKNPFVSELKKIWLPHRESNPGRRRERPES